MSNIESGVGNGTSSYSAEKSGRNRCVLRCDLNIPMLPELQMANESPFQTVGAAEEEARMAAMWRADSSAD